MTDLLFPARPNPVLPVEGEADFPIGRIFCVGRNYADHAKEMGHEVDREAPFYFTKSAHAVLLSGHDMPYPPRTSDLHHEMELVVALKQGGKNIAEADAMSHVFGYGCGLDMTRRDLQAAAKEKRRPWDTGKDFDNAAILGPLIPAEEDMPVEDLVIQLEVNGIVRQQATLGDMVWSISELIADLSTLYTLHPGDLIMTGTPAGVGPVVKGDVLRGTIGDFAPVETRII
ncbi:fumarylacetoacetate hydrolase family protein [Yoonia litorea]|uniref:Fumarylpyruvate hydrolase n=1 Tax=Yoonia litorea TaxID=1123755 RepID=A0A1I6LRR0_9RHOB|nr:fumarylacetoacetate hydrolase family protein [Yoonia litorea]SFS06134.1 fumarylpyruvate hydrolase [Yoonia litorea]